MSSLEDNVEGEERSAVSALPQRISTGFLVRTIGFLLTLLLGGAVFLHAMGQGLNHDEHQFLASAALWAREGLVPYRDFAVFHLPNLIFAYGWAAQFTDDLLYGPKLLTVLGTTGVIGMIYWLAFARVGNALRPWERLWVATGVSLLLLLDPLFLFTSGKTWNHEIPAFFLVVAITFHVESLRRRSWIYAAISGLAGGLAVGCRLTFAPPCVAFLLHHAIWGGGKVQNRLRLAAGWGGGCLVGLLPTLYVAMHGWESFIFDNLRFPRLMLLDPENTRAQQTAKFIHKVRYLFKEVLPRSWPLAILYFGIGLLPLVQAFRHRRSGRGGTVFSVLLSVFVLVGCFSPTRYQYQHFYVLTVVAAIGIIYRCKEMVLGPWERRGVMAVIGLLVVVSVVGYLPATDRDSGWRAYLEARAMRDPAAWFSNKYRQQANVLQRYVPAGVKVVTLAPALVLEANRRIYPEFVTGPFAWRTAKLVPAEERKRLHLVAPDDLPGFMADYQPFAILTGVEDKALEAPLTAYASEHGFKRIELPKERVLWLNEEARAARPLKLIHEE